MRALAPAAEALAADGILMRYTDLLKVMAPVEKAVSQQEGGTHADEIETSMILYMSPGDVDMSKAVKDYHPGKGGFTRDPKKEGKTYSPSGVFGTRRSRRRRRDEGDRGPGRGDRQGDRGAAQGGAAGAGCPADKQVDSLAMSRHCPIETTLSSDAGAAPPSGRRLSSSFLGRRWHTARLSPSSTSSRAARAARSRELIGLGRKALRSARHTAGTSGYGSVYS